MAVALYRSRPNSSMYLIHSWYGWWPFTRIWLITPVWSMTICISLLHFWLYDGRGILPSSSGIAVMKVPADFITQSHEFVYYIITILGNRYMGLCTLYILLTYLPRGHLFTDNSFKWIFVNEKFCILTKISLKLLHILKFLPYAALGVGVGVWGVGVWGWGWGWGGVWGGGVWGVEWVNPSARTHAVWNHFQSFLYQITWLS